MFHYISACVSFKSCLNAFLYPMKSYLKCLVVESCDANILFLISGDKQKTVVKTHSYMARTHICAPVWQTHRGWTTAVFAIRPYAETCAPPAGTGRGRSCSCWSWPAHQAASPPTLKSAKHTRENKAGGGWEINMTEEFLTIEGTKEQSLVDSAVLINSLNRLSSQLHCIQS